MLARPGSGAVERVAHDPLHPGAGEDRGLGRNLLRQAAMGAPAMAGIFAFRVLPDDQPVQITDADIAQRAGDAGQDARRADIGVLVEPLADLQTQAPERNMVRNVGIAHGAEIDRIRRA